MPKQVCILWHAAERSPADALVRALINRGLAVTLATSKHAVFAAACQCDQSANRVVIVLDDRESLVGVDRVLDGLERFGPGVICWEHCPGANPPMVPVVRTVEPKAQVQQDQQDHADHVPGRDIPAAKLRLVNENETNENQSTANKPAVKLLRPIPKGGTISSSDVLDADELDALLAGEMGEGRRGK